MVVFQGVVQHVGALTTNYGPRRSVAMVTDNSGLLEMGQRYVQAAHLPALAVGLFLTIGDGERWLAEAH
jgi:hypothetical protein